MLGPVEGSRVDSCRPLVDSPTHTYRKHGKNVGIVSENGLGLVYSQGTFKRCLTHNFDNFFMRLVSHKTKSYQVVYCVIAGRNEERHYVCLYCLKVLIRSGKIVNGQIKHIGDSVAG